MVTEAQSPDYDEGSASIFLYEPIVFEKGLERLHFSRFPDFDQSTSMRAESLISNEQWFHCFLDKVAQVCDSERGGETVTAVAVLQDLQGPIYVLGSNQRSQRELGKTEEYLKRLLSLIGENPDRLKDRTLRKHVMWQALEFGIKRVDLYLRILIAVLDQCIGCCQTQGASELEQDLTRLKTTAVFPRDIVSDANAKNKFFSDCDTLIKAIHARRNTDVDEQMRKRANGEVVPDPRPWRELRHHCGRLLSYRQAAEVLVSANERWPGLFKEIRIATIRSSKPMPCPLPNQPITAPEIIEHMGLGKEQAEHFVQRSHVPRELGLDRYIEDQWNFRPIVHAEVLVHDAVHQLGVPADLLYWNKWKYIGSSKPTCRLCSYYFEAQDIAVRAPHYNLYRAWRLPDLPKVVSRETIEKRRRLLQQLTEHARQDVQNRLDNRQVLGRRHDSLTSSAVMASHIEASSDIPSGFHEHNPISSQ
ncbi:hypothetical protein BJ170DRAFT_687445 [Xylariales sp. AK1849]|nr:hypothetical protein BJ170DRAFT_687445 [Xylariales sp. AK1849]